MAKVPDWVERPDLKYRSFRPAQPKELAKGDNIFASVRKQDILLHHPYDSFSTSVQAFLAQAAADPRVLIADEPTTALDVTVQAQILTLLKELQARLGMAILFITHDLAVVDMLADRIMVMHKGEIVEHGDADQVMNNPQNPYTQKLLASLPVPDPREQRKHRAQLHELLSKGI